MAPHCTVIPRLAGCFGHVLSATNLSFGIVSETHAGLVYIVHSIMPGALGGRLEMLPQ